jgi:TRAP-type C4-dicarboxylate transport system permease large subunit
MTRMLRGMQRKLVPFLLVEVAVLILVTYVPVLSTWLPSVL